jgi:hypothetical protein
MFVRRQPMIEFMDRTAEWLWGPVLRLLGVASLQDLLMRRSQAHSFRFFPVLLLLGCLAGLGAMMAGWRITGLMIFNAAWITTTLIQGRSPLMAGPRGRDEREAALVRSGHLWGLGAVALVAVLGCFYFALALPMPDLGGKTAFALIFGGHPWFPAQPLDWMELALFLMAIEINVAVLAASWLLPKGVSDEE